MLSGRARAGPRKGHAYSKWDAFRALPATTQALFGCIVFLVLFAVVQFLPSSTSSLADNEFNAAGGDPSAAAGGSRVPIVPGGDGANAAAGQSAVSEALAEARAARAEAESLRRQLADVTENNRRLSSALNSAGAGGGTNAPPSTALQDSGNPLAPIARDLGPLDWENLRIEDNSTQRRFWVKTATNEEGHHFYRRILISNGWIETALPRRADCVWQFYGRFVPNLGKEYDVFTEGRNLINHIPGEFAVLNKEPFLNYMRNNSIAAGCDYTEMHPESYLVHKVQECEMLFAPEDKPANVYHASSETRSQRDRTYWFWKPPGNSFGRGIKISSLAELRDHFGFGKELDNAPDPKRALHERCMQLARNLTAPEKKNKLLIQRAVHNPYLIRNTKFDFRAYILIANAKPYVVYHKFGHVRRCLRTFDIRSRVKKAHVCNDYSDELDRPGFPLNDHIWDIHKFREFLISEGYSAEEFDRGFVHNLKRLFLGVFKTFKDVLPRKNGYWLMLGLDVAIDEDWGLYVLEVNTNPSMHYGTKIWGQEIVKRNWLQMNEVLQLVWHSHLMSKRLPYRSSDFVMKTKYGWELIYSDGIQPPYQYSQDQCFVQKRLDRHPPNVVRISDRPVGPDPNLV